VAVMEKVGTQDVARMESFKGLSKWKEIRLLVTEFPEQGWVHGDLRLVNSIFTGGTGSQMMLVGEGMMERSVSPWSTHARVRRGQRLR
jgi:hypothetical protein